MHQQLEAYLTQVRTQLKSLPQHKQDEEIQEIRQHLLALIASEVEKGSGEDEAVVAAIRQFGSPKQVGKSLRQSWMASRNQNSFTTPLNKFFSAALWSVAASVAWGFLSAAMYGGWAGVYFGSQLKRGNTNLSPEDVPFQDFLVMLVNTGSEVVGVIVFLLALWGRLPTFHLERK